jgi:hypothetical protein
VRRTGSLGYQLSGRYYQTRAARIAYFLMQYVSGPTAMTRKTAGAVAVSLVSIDKLTAEQRAGLVAASQEARPSEEYRIQFAALAQRRLEMHQATAISRGSAGDAALR